MNENIWDHVREEHPEIVEGEPDTSYLRSPGSEFSAPAVAWEWLREDHENAHLIGTP